MFTVLIFITLFVLISSYWILNVINVQNAKIFFNEGYLVKKTKFSTQKTLVNLISSIEMTPLNPYSIKAFLSLDFFGPYFRHYSAFLTPSIVMIIKSSDGKKIYLSHALFSKRNIIQTLNKLSRADPSIKTDELTKALFEKGEYIFSWGVGLYRYNYDFELLNSTQQGKKIIRQQFWFSLRGLTILLLPFFIILVTLVVLILIN